MLAKKLGVTADYLETGSEIRDTDERELRIADAELELRLADDPAEAEKKLEQLRDEAVAAGDALAASRANIALGLAAAAAGRNADAIERLEAGLELSPVSPSAPTGRVRDARPGLRRHLALGQGRRGVRAQPRRRSSRTRPRTLAAQVRFTTYLSFALTDMGDLERAQSVLDAALEKADAMTDAYSRVRLYWGLARLNDLQGRPAAALDYVRRAIALLDVTDDTLHLARAHLLCGDILMAQGRAEEAGRNFDIAEQLFGPNPEPDRRRRTSTPTRPGARCSSATARRRSAGRVRRSKRSATSIRHEQGNALWALAEGLALTGETDARARLLPQGDLAARGAGPPARLRRGVPGLGQVPATFGP